MSLRFECLCRLDAQGAASLELSGELDRAVCHEFETRLAEAQRASSAVALDLRCLSFIDAAGYTALFMAARNSRPETKMVLTGCSGQVRRFLDLTGLPENVEMRESPNRSGASIGA